MSYLDTKKKRKKTKYNNILSKDLGINLSASPSSVLVICNGGLNSGVTHDMVCKEFEKFGNLENVIMVPEKSYSFLKFQNESDAIEAYDQKDGKVIWSKVKGPIYLGYVDLIPSSLHDQNTNFKKPPGLVLLENFITEEEEEFISKLIKLTDEDKRNSSELKHRKVKHYGYEFKYTTNDVDLNDPIERIPKELDFLWERLRNCSEGKITFIPDQLTINYYEPGQGIPPHVDTHSPFEDGILSLSLKSTVVMDFKNSNGICYNVLLPRRSLCMMLGESRYDWTHSISPRKSDIVPNGKGGITSQNRETRISLTFRKTRVGDCTCAYPKLCDSAQKNLKNHGNIVSDMRNVNLKVASELEGNYVHEVYEKIATHFSETRHKPWPNVLKFVKSFEVGSVLVDIGCGNGKYFSKQSERFELGCDSSNSLMQVCKEFGFECFSCNCLNIPLRDNVADGCICIAVIHHLTTEERRKQAINEIIRILQSKGRALIYVWAKNQENESKKSSYLKQYSKKEKPKEDCDLQRVTLDKAQEELVLPVHVNRTNFTHNDLLVPWKLKTKNTDTEQAPVYLRFYHVYEDDELRKMCQKLENVEVIDYYYDQGNWCVILQKK